MTSQRSVRTRLTLDVNDYVAGTQRAEHATTRFSGVTVGALAKVATAYGAIKLGGLIKESIDLEAVYSKTMAQVAVATKAPQSELEKLDDLALKMGADTVFSAQDSAAAMLSLAKGGLSTAEVQAGALADTLTLASAGELDLATSADTVVEAMGAFQLKAAQTDEAVAALAGGANASSASVSDMTQALSQAGTEANAAGLTIQETTGFLALFANSGIKGSDAGTSLRTMLSRLVPQTKEAAIAMDALGLSYTDNNGKIVSAEQIAARTQKAFKGLSDEERTTALNTIFGADARRAANVIIDKGATGLRKMVKETSDLTQAQKLADAANSGTAGSLESLKGAAETAQIQFGKGLAPVVQDVAKELSDLVESGDAERWGRESSEAVLAFAREMTPLAVSAFELGREALPAVAEAGGVVVDVLKLAADIITPVVDGFNRLPDSAQKALILAAGAQMLSRRLGPIPGLASSAGGGLFAFGGNARKAGDDVDKAKGKFSGFATSLKGFGLLTAASFGLAEAGHVLGNVTDLLELTGDSSQRFTDTFDRNGKATADTVASIQDAFGEGSVGKYAEDFGIDMERLAESFAESGTQGEYVRDVMKNIIDDRSSWTNWSKEAGAWLPFLETDQERAALMRAALDDLGEEYDKTAGKAREQALAVDENKNAFDLIIGGLGQYSDELKGLPSKAVTEILTPGAIKGKADVLKLAEAYDLTPDQVTTVMEALGFDTKKIKAVQKAMRELDGTTATVTTIEETIKRTIKESFTRKGGSGPNGPGVDAFNDRPYTGMRLPTGYFGGGVVPGIAPSDPTKDNIFAMGANTGQPLMVRSGEWIINEQQSEKNDRWLRMINAGLNLDDVLPGFAGGGRYDTFSSLTKSSRLDLLEQEQRIRNIERSLNEKETVKRDGKKVRRDVIRGLDRTVAEAQLKEERAELARMKRENSQLKNYGTSGQEKRREEAREATEKANEEAAEAADRARRDAEDAAEAQRRAIASAAGDITGGASLAGISSVAGLERMLNRVGADSAAFTQVIADLTDAGASQLVLDVLKKAGPSKKTIQVGRQLLADTAALGRVNQASSNLTQVGQAYGDLTAGAGSISGETRSMLVQIQALDVTQVTGEIQRVVRHELQSIAAGANI